MNDQFRVNNFNLIRILAAVQVLIYHSIRYFELVPCNSVAFKILNFFPGVPVFFFISGYLISKSYENSNFLQQYVINRLVRIYPALIVCTLLSIVTVALTGYFSTKGVGFKEILPWFFAQISIIQFYNPFFMRDFGTGVLNGSIWTISVELQFYFLTPLVYWILLNRLKKRSSKTIVLCIFILFFMFFHIYRTNNFDLLHDKTWFKFFSISFLPWIYMFLMGVLFQINFDRIYRVLAGKAVQAFFVYSIVVWLSIKFLGSGTGTGISPHLFVVLALFVFSLAYSYTSGSKFILKGNDISYGVYIYHIPVVNMLLFWGFTKHVGNVIAVLLITVFLGFVSWNVIEKPSLKFKHYSSK